MRATRWEILGAWLRIWTPPRDVEIPPIPWRKVGALAALTCVVGVLVALFAGPRIEDGKQRRATGQQRAEAALSREALARLRCHENPRPAEGASLIDVVVDVPRACSGV